MFTINNTRVGLAALGIMITFSIIGCTDQPDQKVSYAVEEALTEARVFAEGVITTNQEQNISFTPDGTTVFFERVANARGALYASDFADGKWGEPYIPEFSIIGESEGNAFVSPDGSKVYFTSTRPSPNNLNGGYNLWYAERSGDGWGEAVDAGKTVNSPYGGTYPAVAANGNLYFNSARPDSNGLIAVYWSQFKDGEYSTPELLGQAINNGSNPSLTPYIAHDESYLIFCRIINETDADLYISYNQNGEWLPAEPLSQAVNLAGSIETAPSVSPDGRYFFFSRLTGSGENGGAIYQVEAAQAGIRSEKTN